MDKKEIVLVACEESQAITIELRKKGIEAYSCDILPCSGGYPEWHIQGDAIEEAYSGKYTSMIGNPPCTFLCNSGVRWIYQNGKANSDKSNVNKQRWKAMQEGAKFFTKLLNAPVERIAIENSIMHQYAKEIVGKNQDQVIQPWMFGHPDKKGTCLWLKGFPELKPTKTIPKQERKDTIHFMSPGPERNKLRSKTFQGIAKAIADQWF